jgi:hypothetical protein
VTLARKSSIETSCAGELIMITPNIPEYIGCTQSTFLPNKDCKAGLMGKGVD